MRTLAALLALALAAAPPLAQAADWQPTSTPLVTRWAKGVSPERVHPEYPRPQMVRKDWLNLNGLWDLAIAETGTTPTGTPSSYPERILVPFPVESALSGIGKRAERIWYRRGFNVPPEWSGRRVLLRFEAVDWETTVTLNGKELGAHRGGYDPFSFDITDHLKPSASQELQVVVFDPSDQGEQPRGKQVTKPRSIWYTPSTGIWQTVWLEAVPDLHISALDLQTSAASGQLTVRVSTTGTSAGAQIISKVIVTEKGVEIASASGPLGSSRTMKVPDAKLWSPETPHLYDLRIELQRDGKVIDSVESYFGMRDIALVREGNFQRIALNGKPLFQVGPLDQGFWPDGLHTAPTDEALRWDIEFAKRLGFNMIRKHIKVEPARWYYWADKLGVLVWQDMPNGRNRTPESRVQFETELARMIAARRNSPAIVMWVVFNEGWGQYDTERLTAWVKGLDPSRLVNNASGWVDKACGDIFDMHKYPGPGAPDPETTRASVLGEFGGLGLKIEGHTWSREYWGYQGTSSTEHLTSRYQQLMRRVWLLEKERGLCAAVYTQTTDVETETNGLVTYDREVVKVDEKRIREANLNQLTPVTIATVVPTSEHTPQTWRYTFDKPRAGWNTPTFDDSTWKEGLGGFGMADTGGAVRTTWDSKDIHLRRWFELRSDVAVDTLYLNVHHDDDVEVFLNGTSAVREKGYRTGYEEMPIGDAARATLKPGRNQMSIRCRHIERGCYIDAGLITVREEPATVGKPAQ